MAASSKWVRLNIDWDDTEWVDNLSNAAQLAWIKLLCHVKKEGSKGRCRAISATTAARKWGITDHNGVMEALRVAEENKALEITDGEWVLVNWSVYQEPDATGAKRQEEFRRRQEEQRNQTDSNLHNAVTQEHNGVLPSRDHRPPTDYNNSNQLQEVISLAPTSENVAAQVAARESSKRFKPPTVQEVEGYMVERGWVDPHRMAEAFVNSYQSKGWLVGKTPMKDWQACVRTWEAKEPSRVRGGPSPGFNPPPRRNLTADEIAMVNR